MGTLVDCFLDYISKKEIETFQALPCLFKYGIWMEINLMIFQDKVFRPVQVVQKSRMALDDNKKIPEETPIIFFLMPLVDQGKTSSRLDAL